MSKRSKRKTSRSDLQRIEMNIDGGSRFGKASAACVIKIPFSPVITRSESFWGTNNTAEYKALLLGLSTIREIELEKDSELVILSDSRLIVEQVNGRWKCREPHLDKLRTSVKSELGKMPKKIVRVSLSWIPRSKNKKADYLCDKEIETADYNRPHRL